MWRRWAPPLRRAACRSAGVQSPHHGYGLGLAFPGDVRFGTRSFAAVRIRHKGSTFVPRREAAGVLFKARKRHGDQTLLLPPFVSATELRIIFRVDYAGVFRLLGVKKEASKYYYRDLNGRAFETASKRKVLVPFDVAAIPAQNLGFKPVMVDVEPDWDMEALRSSRPAPVVAVLGHINHGKTTLLDALCGTSVAPHEPGGITQEVRALTGCLVERPADLNPLGHTLPGITEASRQPLVALFQEAHDARLRSSSANEQADEGAAYDPRRVTFLDTPGHEAFEVQRGRTMASADVGVVLVSVERGAEVQTEEVLMHAARWKVPVVFALNKIDLPDAHVELTRAELRRQCQRLHELGLVDVDWTREAEEAIPISALRGLHLDRLVQHLRKKLEELPSLPLRLLTPPTSTPGAAMKFKEINRRTDFLVGIESPPSAAALVVEYLGGGEQGETVLTCIVRAGRLMVGQYFVVGTALGRISQLAIADGAENKRWNQRTVAGPGVAVHVMGLRKRQHGGDCSTDDVLFVLPKERAWRLSEHRRRIEALLAVQSSGEPIEVPWQHDGAMNAVRAHTDLVRSKSSQPEKHSDAAWERRQFRPAVEELAGRSSGALHVFSQAPIGDFEAPLASGSLDNGHPRDLTHPIEASISGGRKHSRFSRENANLVVSRQGLQGSRFQVAVPETQAHAYERSTTNFDNRAEGGSGRKSRRASAETAKATGAWTEGTSSAGQPNNQFVYYLDKRTWTEEADIDSTRSRARWQWRDTARWEEEARQERMRQEEQELAAATRRELFGEAARSRKEGDDEDSGDSSLSDDELREGDDEPPRPLPPKSSPIVPMILKTKSVTQFDVLMDEIERVQAEYAVRIAIVHGGLGPVIPKDVVHAEVEKRYGLCPIYAFQVGVHPVALGQAQKERIDIRRFDVFTELIADVAGRCERIHQKEGMRTYTASLKRRPTISGF